MSWLRWAAAIVAAGAVAVTGYAGMSVSAQQPAPQLAQDQKKMVVDCAAVYRWQAGAGDPSYKRLEALYAQFAGLSPIVADESLSINRDKFDEAVSIGKLNGASMQKWLDTCADFTTLPAPPGPVRARAFPEEPKPESVKGLLDCLALARWELGPFSYNVIVGRDRYIAYARLRGDDAEDNANAEIKRRVENIDKALLAGAGSLSDLVSAAEPCHRDYHIIITGIGDRKMSLEYENEHPQAPSSALAGVDINTITASGSSYSSNGGGSSSYTSGSASDGEDHRLFTSGGVDVTNTTSSSECVEAMDNANTIMQPDLNALTRAMERDRQYCSPDSDCTFTANGAAILACASVNRARGEVPSQCLKERAILDNLREQVCPGSG